MQMAVRDALISSWRPSRNGLVFDGAKSSMG
jgi:hypothetical protein